MSVTRPTITCVFFNDASVAAFLNSAAGRPFAGELLVECALAPTLCFGLNVETPPNFPGIAGLLGGVEVGTLAHGTDLLPAPVVFAPGAPVSATAARSALQRLERTDTRLTAISLLVPMEAARTFGASLAIADRHLIAWDATSAPSDTLVDFARWLATEQLIGAHNFAGLFAYATSAIEFGHAQLVSDLLQPFAARSPLFPAGITAVLAR